MYKNNPSVDVIMPTYNGRNTIKDAIDSVLHQSYTNWILTIVNDGGEDISDIVNGYNDPRINLIILKKNKGLPYALNTGIRNTNGIYISLLDDDDIWYKDHIKKLLEGIESNNTDCVYSNIFYCKER